MLSHFLRTSKSTVTNNISYINTYTSSTNTVTYPAGIIAGDIIYLCLSKGDANSATPPTITNPSGYTVIGTGTSFSTTNADANRSTFYYRLANGTETGSFTWASTGGTFFGTRLILFRKSTPATGITALSFVTQGTPNGAGSPTNPANQVVPSGSGNSPLIVIARYGTGGGGTITTQGFSPTEDATIANTKYKIYNSSPQNVTVSMVGSSGTTREMASFYLQVT